MRDYGRVAPTFWMRGSGKKLRGNPRAQLVALYLFTSPASTMIGIYHLAIPTMAHETGLPLDDAKRALAEICAQGIAKYDPDAELVYLPEGAKYQIGEHLKPGDKRVRGIEAALAQRAPLRERLRVQVRGRVLPSKPHPGSTGSPFEAPSRVHRKPLRSQARNRQGTGTAARQSRGRACA